MWIECLSLKPEISYKAPSISYESQTIASSISVVSSGLQLTELSRIFRQPAANNSTAASEMQYAGVHIRWLTNSTASYL